MSKKRDNNRRKKQLKKRQTKRLQSNRKNVSNVLAELGFEITDEPIEDDDFQRLPVEVQEQMEKLYDTAQTMPGSAIKELQELLSKYPHIPQIYNYLYAAYMHAGEKTKAMQIMKRNYNENPTYLFARLNYTDYLVESGELEKVADVYNNNFDLKKLYPDRDVFHITEVTSFFGVIGYYYVMIGEYKEARKCLRVLSAISPHHGYTVRLKNMISSRSALIA
jgi:tetratricopeptide (TPR) repeat protein